MATAEEAEAEAEALAEVEAVQAVYGDDCVVMDSYPPHLHVHIKPRTADVTSQQVPLIFSLFRVRIELCLVADTIIETENENFLA